MRISRREFLELGLAVPGFALLGCADDDAADDGWNRGDLRHLLPTVSHRSFNLKLSFGRPPPAPPTLHVGSREIAGSRLDSDGRFWAFRVGRLAPATSYSLRLRDSSGQPLCDAWPLRTLPAPDSQPDQLRVIAYTCAGGPNLPIPPSLFHAFKPAAYRRRLIASTYGVRLRSTPVFFITDDHDYFDNDDATPERVTFPPDPFHRELRDALQRLYFPEFIAEDDPGEPIPGWERAAEQASADVRLSTHFGEIRFGDLFAGLLYDCGGYLSLGDAAGLVPASVEAWLVDRTTNEDTAHLVHFPSHPAGWTAGKWREWYPDFLASTGSIVAAVTRDAQGNKYQWQEGWWRQHQRLLEALSSQQRRHALMVSGDLHALGVARIERSGALDLSANPVYSVLSGPVGTGEMGWPSRARGVETRAPADLEVSRVHPLEERNGFTVLDFDRERCRIELLRCPDGYVSPGSLRLESAVSFTLG